MIHGKILHVGLRFSRVPVFSQKNSLLFLSRLAAAVAAVTHHSPVFPLLETVLVLSCRTYLSARNARYVNAWHVANKDKTYCMLRDSG